MELESTDQPDKDHPQSETTSNEVDSGSEAAPEINQEASEATTPEPSIREILAALAPQPETSTQPTESIREILRGLDQPNSAGTTPSPGIKEKLEEPYVPKHSKKENPPEVSQEAAKELRTSEHVLEHDGSITLKAGEKFPDPNQFGLREGMDVLAVATAPDSANTPEEERGQNKFIVVAYGDNHAVLGLRPDPEAPGKFTPANEEGTAPARRLTMETPVVIGTPETSRISIGKPETLEPNGLIFTIEADGSITIRNNAETNADVLTPPKEEMAAQETQTTTGRHRREVDTATPEDVPAERGPEAPETVHSPENTNTEKWAEIFSHPDRVLETVQGTVSGMETADAYRLRELAEAWQTAQENEPTVEVWRDKYAGELTVMQRQAETDRLHLQTSITNLDNLTHWLSQGHDSVAYDVYETQVATPLREAILEATLDPLVTMNGNALDYSDKPGFEQPQAQEFSKKMQELVSGGYDLDTASAVKEVREEFGNTIPDLKENLRSSLVQISYFASNYESQRRNLMQVVQQGLEDRLTTLTQAYMNPASRDQLREQIKDVVRDVHLQLEELVRSSQYISEIIEGAQQKALPTAHP